MRYIALLRGINISGKNKISMPELKTALGEKDSGPWHWRNDYNSNGKYASKDCRDVKSGFFFYSS